MFRRPDQPRFRQRLNMVRSDDERVGLLRIDGRLLKCPWRKSTMNSIPLPGSHLIVKLYVTRIHQILGHQGYRVVLSYLHKQGIYIAQGRKLLKSISFNCMKCRLFRRRLLTQQMGQLPKFRFNTQFPPFSSIALDYFGPVKMKKTRNVTIDALIILMTCTTTRVVHLEITETQSTNDFLLAWRRFDSKRCIHPTHVFSDSAKPFFGAQKPIREWISNWDKTKIKSHLSNQGTTFEFMWQFNVPHASHMNGVVESLIRSWRKTLDSTCNYHKFLTPNPSGKR